MSYERQDSTRLEQYRARQAERIDAMNRAIEAGQTTVVASSSENTVPVRASIGVDLKKDAPKWVPFVAGSAAILGTAGAAIGAITSLTGSIKLKARRFNAAPQLAGSAQAGRKKPAAAWVEIAVRPDMIVHRAALIPGSAPTEPQHGDLFAYDARTGKMVPVEQRTVIQNVRAVDSGTNLPRRHTMTVRNK